MVGILTLNTNDLDVCTSSGGTSSCPENSYTYSENSYTYSANKAEPSWSENFSKLILDRQINECKTGKVTKRYLIIYLDFMHISGYLDNLQYVEYKTELLKLQE